MYIFKLLSTLLILLVLSNQALGCCPWLCKAKALLGSPVIYSSEHTASLDAVVLEKSAEAIAAGAGTGLGSHDTFEFVFRIGSGPEETKSVLLHPAITKREFKEKILKACGQEDYQNMGYIVNVYNGAGMGLVSIFNSDDKPVGIADIDKIKGFKDSLVVAQPI